MNKIVKVVDNRSTAPRTEPFYARADKVIAEWSKSSGWGLAGAEADLAQFDAVLPQAEAVLKDLLLAERPASKQEIVKNLAVLVGCFSNGSMNAEIYSRTLAEYVLDEKPSIGELRIFAVAHGGIPHGPSQQFLGGGLPGFDDLGVNALSPVFPNL